MLPKRLSGCEKPGQLNRGKISFFFPHHTHHLVQTVGRIAVSEEFTVLIGFGFYVRSFAGSNIPGHTPFMPVLRIIERGVED